jgi:hypothetical protein
MIEGSGSRAGSGSSDYWIRIQ